jgi:SSS family solute:Na+ symporter
VTPLLVVCLLLLALYGLYIAARVARLPAAPGQFLDAGGRLPGWAVMFALPGLALAGLGIQQHLGLVATFGLQASHVGLGVVVVAMAALLAWNRLWYAAHAAGLSSPGEALGRAYASVALRVVVLALALLFALPYAANILSFAAMLLEDATDGVVPRAAGCWLMALSLAIPAIVGGWRAIVLTIAMQSLLLALLLPGTALVAELAATGAGFPAAAIPVADGVLWDRIPGVVQYAGGIGKAQSAQGIFSAVAISSNSLALVGLVLSPAGLYLGQTMRAGRTLGVSTVWLTAGLVAGTLILCAPMLALRSGADPVGLAGDVGAFEPIAGVGMMLLLLVGAFLAVSFFVTAGVLLVTREAVLPYLLPGLSESSQRLAARIGLGFGFFAMAFMASFLPLASAILASVALPLAVQLVPALLGITFLRWISRGAVLAGLAIGALIVFFTEPPGLILFEGLFVELPWGRWPLTIHSAAWGLSFNLLIVLLSAVATLGSQDRFERDRLHDALFAATRVTAGNRGLLWALLLLWGFFGYGPGAVLGNSFFSEPVFSPNPATLGVPSLWVWQILFWLLGVVLVWWLAYRVGFGVVGAADIRPIVLGAPAEDRAPGWLAQGLRRIRGQPARPARAKKKRIELIRPGGPPTRRGSSGSES